MGLTDSSANGDITYCEYLSKKERVTFHPPFPPKKPSQGIQFWLPKDLRYAGLNHTIALLYKLSLHDSELDVAGEELSGYLSYLPGLLTLQLKEPQG